MEQYTNRIDFVQFDVTQAFVTVPFSITGGFEQTADLEIEMDESEYYSEDDETAGTWSTWWTDDEMTSKWEELLDVNECFDEKECVDDECVCVDCLSVASSENQETKDKNEWDESCLVVFDECGLLAKDAQQFARDLWIADTGATSHMTPSREFMVNVRPVTKKVRMGNKEIAEAKWVGDLPVLVHQKDGTTQEGKLKDVLVCQTHRESPLARGDQVPCNESKR